jgi:hypothetical protein
MSLFRPKKATDKRTTLRDCVQMVEGFFKKINANPNDQRLPDRNALGWWIQRGSAMIYIFLNQGEDNITLRILSPLLYLPEDFVLPFYRRCLEINMRLINCALAASDDKILLVTERPIEGLDQQELESSIHYLAAVADEIDNKLSAEFNARMYNPSDS